jgi:hypothetical protein
VVVVVVAGEAAAWAGTITDLTTGLTQRSGKTSGLNEPPPSAMCKMRRRSTVMFEDPPQGAFDAPTPEHSHIGLRGSAQARRHCSRGSGPSHACIGGERRTALAAPMGGGPRKAESQHSISSAAYNETAEPFVRTKKKVHQRRFKNRRITQL